jgi:hypothetical protein
MSAHLLTRAEIIDAICRVNATDTHNPVAWHGPTDGTYRIIPTWVGSARVWMAQKLSQESGFEVAYESIEEGPFWYDLGSARLGIWTDPETGRVRLDRTVNVRGSEIVAIDTARLYDQLAIWDWAAGASISIDD